MKSIRKSTIVFASVIMLSLMVSIIFLGNRVEAKELENGGVSVKYDGIDEYYGKTAPAYEEGYVFAGWYEDEECSISYVQKEGETLEGYYAKFVPESVLSVKAQNETKLLDTVLSDDATGQIRFVTSVDSLNYKEVGLHIEGQIGNTTLNKDYSIKKVYTYLYATGTTDKEAEPKTAATVFGTSASEYFAAQAFRIRFDQFSDNFTVTPYWVTPDGVRVNGVKRTRSMIDNLEDSSYAEVNRRAYYTTNNLSTISATTQSMTGTEEAPTVVTLLKDVVVSQQSYFGEYTKITNKPGVNVTISKATEVDWVGTGACLFFTNGKTLVIAGADNSESITIDGKNEKSLIRNNATLVAENVTFMNGVREGDNGGAINATGSTGTIINQCAFEKNCAKNGGAVYVTNGSLQITDSKFSDNQATTEHGGAVFVGANAQVTLTASSEQVALKSFTNNKAVAGSGGAIMVNGANAEVSVTGYTFTGNDAKTMGGAIRFCNGATFDVESCKFISNIANAASTAAGGAIYAQKDTTVKDCTFTSNSAPNFSGGAIDARAILMVNNSTFTSNSSSANGGAVYVTSGSLQMTDSTLDGNYTATGHGGAVAVMTAAESNITNTVFYNNETRGAGAGGGALHVTAATLNAISCEFGKEGAANTAKTYGGAIYVTGSTGILNLSVDNNKGTYRSFNYNTAASGGGAIAARGNGTAIVDGYTFKENKVTTNSTSTAIYGGGAIYAGSKTTVKNSVFASNSAYDGGTILANDSANVVAVETCEFNGNTSSHRGAAIYVQKGAKGIEITGSNFSKNETKGHGGAVFTLADLTVNQCEFTSNTASGSYGGAIDQEAGSGTVLVSVFNGNKAGSGGAVGSTGGQLTLENCDFTNNTATAAAGGAACVTGSGKITIQITDGTQRSFEGNTDTKGNALHAKANSSIEYSSLYGEAKYGTEGNPVGTVTKITQ